MYGLAAILGAVCVWSLAGKALPWLYEDYERVARLRAPVGYWNALALLGAVALPIGLCLATRRRVARDAARLRLGRRDRADLLARRRDRRRARRRGLDRALARLGGGARDARRGRRAGGGRDRASRSRSTGVTSDGQSHSTRVTRRRDLRRRRARGRSARRRCSRASPPPEPTAAVRRAALALLAVVAAAAIVVGATHARSWWDSFTSPTVAELPNSPDRFTEAGSNYRWTWWKQAWRGWKEHPVAGTGAGSFGFTNLRYRTTSVDQTTEPHSLPVQFLTETGVVGLLLFVVAGARPRRRRAPPGGAAARARARPARVPRARPDRHRLGLRRRQRAGLPDGRRGRGATRARRGGLSASAVLVGGGVAFAVVCSLFAVWLGDRWTATGIRIARPPGPRGRAREAGALGQPAGGRAALRPGPRRSSSAATSARRSASSRRRRGSSPDNAEAWFALGEFDLVVRNCPRAALLELDRFTQLNPQDPGNKEYDRALKLVNSGTPIC